MGPKKGKAPKETEEEKAAREAEEKKQADIAAKKAAIEAENKRQQEIKLALERKAYREDEIARLCNEHTIIIDKKTSRTSHMIAEEKTENDKLEWLKYTDPNDEIDATNEKDLNMFISLTSEHQSNTSYDIVTCMTAVKDIEKLLFSVEKLWGIATALNDHDSQRRYKNYISVLSSMITDKIDTATTEILRFADINVNDKGELQVEETATKVSMGIWLCTLDVRPNRKSVEFNAMGIKIDLPKQLLQQDAKYAIRVIRAPIDPTSFEAYDSNPLYQSNKYVLGDLIIIDLLYPPPASHMIRQKKYVIRDKSDVYTKLKKCTTYPTNTTSKCFIKVPDTFIMTDDVRLALWDDNKSEWTEDGITEYQYSESTRMISFYLCVIGTFALVRDRNADFPYKKWSLSTRNDVSLLGTPLYKEVYEKQARLTVKTNKNVDVSIDINGSKCKLVRPNTQTFSDIVNVEMNPGILLRCLQQKGINLLPCSNDMTTVDGIIPKNVLLETNVYESIAECSNCLDFQSSSWSQQLQSSDGQIGIQARESTTYTGAHDTYDYECLLCELDEVSESHRNSPDTGVAPQQQKYLLVLGNEYGKRNAFSHHPRPKEVTRLDVATCMASRLTVEAINRINSINGRFQKCIYTLLQLMRPCSLS